MSRERTSRWVVCVLACIVGILTGAGSDRASVRAQRGADAGGEWRTYGGDLGNTKYSALDQINASNFGRLKIAWRWKSADTFLSRTVSGGELWASSRAIFDQLKTVDPQRWRDGEAPYVSNFKATPLMVGGRLFVNTPTSVGAAIDARTGATLWIFNPKSYETGTTTMSARWNQRGVAYWSDGKEQRIFWGTGDGYLLAVDALSGAPIESFGDRGRVDLMKGLPRAVRGSRDWLNALTYSVQSPPIVVRDTIITPASISSYNRDKEQIPGYTRGWDVRTGRLKWTFNTVPRPGEFGNETWENDSWSYTGKVSGWTIFSADEALGYVYVPLNTAAPDYYGGHRLGDNLFSDTLLCLDVETGRRVWHQQLTHHDLWDYDLPAAPNLLDITVDGKMHQGCRTGDQAGARVHLRPRDGPSHLADRRAAGSAFGCSGGAGLADAAVSDQAATVRVSGRHQGSPRRLYARDSRDGGEGRSALPVGAVIHAAFPHGSRRQSGHAGPWPASRMVRRGG